jgi:hypothetical protein
VYVGCYSGHRVIESRRRGLPTLIEFAMKVTPTISAADIRAAAIAKVVRAIKRGSFMSYGEVARHAGLPGRARLEGASLSRQDPRTRANSCAGSRAKASRCAAAA